MLSNPDFVTKWKRNSSSFYIFDKFPNSMINKIIYTKFATPDVDDILTMMGDTIIYTTNL